MISEIALFVLSLMVQMLVADQASITPLQPGKVIERQMSGGQTHSYSVTLDTGQFLRAVFDQRGIDIAVTAFGPDQKKIVEVDSPNGAEGPEVLELVASTPGTYRIDVGAFDKNAKPARYEARIDELMSAEEYSAHRAKELALAEKAAQEVARVAIPLRTTEPGQRFDDLQPLRRTIGNSNLVLLGEATHGTHEFFQLKHRLLEFLVTQMGFTVFCLEATMAEAFDINDYVLTGNGDARKALSALYFWAWNTEEVLEMIEWMRRYNADPLHRRKVKFYGFDMQQPVRAAKVTLAYLSVVDPNTATEAAEWVQIFANPVANGDFDRFTPEKKEAALAAVRMVLKRFDERKQVYIKKSSTAAWTFARQHTQLLAQNIELRNGDPTGSTRDRSMAENIRWILQREGQDTRMVVWAHNDHVATDLNSMGTFLRNMFGKQMRVFGFAFNRGSFQAMEPGVGLHSFTVPAAPADSFDAIVAKANVPLVMIDFHALPAGSALSTWLREPRVTRDIGAVYRESDANSYLVKRSILDRYDALFFANETTAARPNRGTHVIARIEPLPLPANLGFEDQLADGSPKQWVVLPPNPQDFDFDVTCSEEDPRSGRRAGVIRRRAGKHYGEMAASLLQQVDAKPYRGKTIRFRASVKNRGNGQSFLWLKVPRQFEERRVITNRDWTEYELTGAVASNSASIEYGIALTGDGEAWIDSAAFDVVETPSFGADANRRSLTRSQPAAAYLYGQPPGPKPDCPEFQYDGKVNLSPR